MNLQSDPFFSIIIPTYNRRNELARALQYVFDQTESSFEIVVVDDNSTDDTIDFLKSIKDQRLRIVSNRRSKGACGARNTGIKASQAEWIAFLDSDDRWEPNKLELVKKNILSHPEFDMFYSGFCYYSRELTGPPVNSLNKNGDLRPFLGRKNIIGGTSVLIAKKIVLEQIGGFDENFPARQDIDLYMRLSAVSKFYFLRETLVAINFESGNQISKNINNRLEGWIKWNEKHRKDLSLADRLYQQKRLFVFSLIAKKYLLAIKYFPGMTLGVLAEIFRKKA